MLFRAEMKTCKRSKDNKLAYFHVSTKIFEHRNPSRNIIGSFLRLLKCQKKILAGICRQVGQ